MYHFNQMQRYTKEKRQEVTEFYRKWLNAFVPTDKLLMVFISTQINSNMTLMRLFDVPKNIFRVSLFPLLIFIALKKKRQRI